jgi:hypothetical protein
MAVNRSKFYLYFCRYLSLDRYLKAHTYVVHSIISWIGRIVILLCSIADSWTHEMMLWPFFAPVVYNSTVSTSTVIFGSQFLNLT